MGLTIHYTSSLKENVSAEVVHELVRRTALYARKIGCVETSRPVRAEQHGDLALLFVPVGGPEARFYAIVPPERGWLASALPGPGCEAARFGLCQYPRRIPCRAGSAPTGYRGGWQFHSSCKTQYAGKHGWENFRVITRSLFWTVAQ